MHSTIKTTMSALVLGVVLSTQALSTVAQPTQAQVANAERSNAEVLSSNWAEITYRMPLEKQTVQYSELSKKARAFIDLDPDNADLITWGGIISASYAGSRQGLGALKIAKRAKTQLETAMRIDPEALNGGARTSLGTLYYKVPGWPIGFGNDSKAEALLTESATRHPNNVNALFFYGDFLLEQKRFSEAKVVFDQAMLIEPSVTSNLADRGRLLQISKKLQLLEKILS